MTDATNWYGNVFKSWPVKQLGPKPSADMLAQIHALGARPGKQALASAMALRDVGVTNAQIVIACGAPQLNKMRGFITDALLKREAVAPSPEGHTVYKLVVTPKGLQRIKQTEARAAKAEAAGQAETADKPLKGEAKVKAGKIAKQGRTAKAARAAKVKAETKAKPVTETADTAPEAVVAAPETEAVEQAQA